MTLVLLEITWPAITDLSSIMTNIANALTVIWGMFTTFLSQVTGNPILLFAVLMPIVVSVIMIVMKILRKFGVR